MNKKRSILVVDDERQILRAIYRVLEPYEYEVLLEEDPRKALDILQSRPVDVLITDHRMPVMSGLDLLGQAREIAPDTIRILMSGYSDIQVVIAGINSEKIFYYITKPWSANEIQDTIEKALSQKEEKERTALLLANRSKNQDDNDFQLYVYCFGEMNLSTAKGDALKAGSTKGMELLAYLLLHRGKYVSKWVLVEDIFPEMPPKNAEIYLNTTIYKLRKALEPCGLKASVLSANESYRMDTTRLYLDFVDFEDRLQSLKTIDAEHLEQALDCEKLYSGALLETSGYAWSLPESQRLSVAYRQFALKLGTYLLEHGPLLQAQHILKRMTLRDELDEDANCLLMKAYAARKEGDALTSHFNQYKKLLEKELGLSPGQPISSLYASLKNSLR